MSPLSVVIVLWLLITSFPFTTTMPSGLPMNKYEKEMVVSIYKWLLLKGPAQLSVTALSDGLYTKIALTIFVYSSR